MGKIVMQALIGMRKQGCILYYAGNSSPHGWIHPEVWKDSIHS